MSETIPQRRCIRCNATFPATTNYFYADKSMHYGVGSCCKKCGYVRKPGVREQINYRRTASFTPVQLPLFITSKHCYGCQKVKDMDEFPIANDKRDGHRTLCTICWNARIRKRYAGRADQNKDESAKKKAKRRSRMQTNGIIETVNLQEILERDGMWCYICQRNILPEQQIEYDHVIPLALDGTHIRENLKVTHRICNRRKHHNLLEEMTPYQRRGV